MARKFQIKESLMGWFISVIIDDKTFMLEFFKLIRIGISGYNNDTGLATCLLFGIWKLESNITLAVRKELDWHNVGKT